MSQSDSVQSVDFARELLSPLSGEWITSFNKQVLNGEAFAHAMSLESKPAVSKIESVAGDVTIGRANDAIVEAHRGEVIHRGDAVQTGGDDAAGTSLLDGPSFEVSAGSRAPLDGPGPGTKRIQLALSDVRVDDEPIRPFGVYDLLDGSRVIDTIDSPDAVVEVRRSITGQLSVTRSSADPSAQAKHYNDTLQIQNLGAEYGINPNARGSGTSPGQFLQPINFTIDLPDALRPPSIDPIGPRTGPLPSRVPDDPVMIIPSIEPPVVRASLTPVPVAGPSFADTVTFDEFTAVTGTVSASNPNPGTTLTFGIAGGTSSGTSSASISGPGALNAASPVGETYDVSARGAYGTLYLNSATGAYIFVPDDAAINALTEDATEIFIITVSDGTTTVSQPFTIMLNGENDEPLLSPVTGSGYADTATLDDFDAVTGTLHATDVDAGATLTYGIAGGVSGGPVVLNGVSYDVSQRGTYGTLYVNSATGSYVFVPDDTAINGLTADTTENFTFTVSDGTLTDSQSFEITLVGRNDKPVLSPVTGPTYTDRDKCDDFAAAAGTLQASDVDTGTALTYGIAGGTSCHPIVLHGVTYDVSQRGHYGTLYVDSATGDYIFVPNDRAINDLCKDTTETFTLTVSDGELRDSQPFTVTLDNEDHHHHHHDHHHHHYHHDHDHDHDHHHHDHHHHDANTLTASNEATSEGAETASVAQPAAAELSAATDGGSSDPESVSLATISRPEPTADSQSSAPPAGEASDHATVTLTQTVSVESSWIASFASHDDGCDHFDLRDGASAAVPTHASPAALVVSAEGLHSLIFHSPPAWDIQSHAPNPVDSQTQPTAGQDLGQPSVDDANNNNELPANQACDVASSILQQLQLRAEPDHFILQP